jgi:hypothetical protein
MRVLGLVLGFMLICGLAYGFDVMDTGNTTSDIPVHGATIAYTKYFPIDAGEYTTVSARAYSSTGTAIVTIELEQSFVAPDSEGTSQGTSDKSWAVPTNMSPIVSSLTNSTYHLSTNAPWSHYALSSLSLPYGRFKLTGVGANNDNTVVNIKVNQLFRKAL